MTKKELQEIADTYGLYTEQDVKNRVSCELLSIGARNEELEAQIEKMKNCHNCRKFHNLSYDCTCAEVCNEWEIKEND